MSSGAGRRRTIEIDPRDADAVAFWKAGARDYVEQLEDWGRYYLYTKPFFTVGPVPDPIPLGYFHDFANIVRALDLRGGSRILDVACGPGWFSEFLWRLGYRVTGIDVCEPLLDFARERVGLVAHPPLERSREDVRFLVLDIETERLDEPFDGIVFYDCLHHFVDAEAVLAHARSMLAPGGRLLIKEGAMPPPGSEGERLLIAEAERLRTLEAPFDHDWLDAHLRSLDFESVRSFVEINGLFERTPAERDRVIGVFDGPPAVNVFLCRVAGGEATAGEPRARLELLARHVVEEARGATLHLELRAHNEGDWTWRSGPALAPGTVTIGIRSLDRAGAVVDDQAGRTLLPGDVAPGASVPVRVAYPLGAVQPPPAALRVDLVLQGAYWFADRGLRPVVVELD
jgi:SAM-dependent methyltransferase